MLEKINSQFQSGRVLNQSRYFNSVDRGLYPKAYWDLHPNNQEYYHELNPFFIFNVYRPEMLELSKTMTLKDGLLPFTNYVLHNLPLLTKSETLLFIPPSYAPVVPHSLKHKFASWHLVQPKKQKIQDAKKIIIFGILNESYLYSLKAVEEKLLPLLAISDVTPIEIYLPMRRNSFVGDKDSIFNLEVVSLITKTLASKNIKLLRYHEFHEISNFRDTYLIDLMYDRILVGESYVDYLVASRGGTVHNFAQVPPKDSLFDLALSFHHSLHIAPLPEVESVFPELLMEKKQYSKEVMYEPGFFSFLRNLIETRF